MTDVTAVRKRLVQRSTGLHDQSKPYVEAIVAGTTAQLPHDRAVADAVEGLSAGNVFAFTLAAVLRVAAESDHPAGPVLAERMARIASEALNSGLDWLDEANDDLDDTEPEPVVRVPGQQEIPAVPDPDDDAPTCRDCGTWPCARHATDEDRAEHAQATSTGFRVGDLVQITGRGDGYDGKTGAVTEIDDNPEYPIGLTVDGFVGLVWCNSTELRHVQHAPGVCTGCGGTGERRAPDPIDPEFESGDPCERCDGAGHVTAESGAAS